MPTYLPTTFYVCLPQSPKDNTSTRQETIALEIKVEKL